MPIVTIGTNNWDEEMVAMKDMPEKLTMYSKEKEVHMNL